MVLKFQNPWKNLWLWIVSLMLLSNSLMSNDPVAVKQSTTIVATAPTTNTSVNNGTKAIMTAPIATTFKERAKSLVQNKNVQAVSGGAALGTTIASLTDSKPDTKDVKSQNPNLNLIKPKTKEQDEEEKKKKEMELKKQVTNSSKPLNFSNPKPTVIPSSPISQRGTNPFTSASSSNPNSTTTVLNNHPSGTSTHSHSSGTSTNIPSSGTSTHSHPSGTSTNIPLSSTPTHSHSSGTSTNIPSSSIATHTHSSGTSNPSMAVSHTHSSANDVKQIQNKSESTQKFSQTNPPHIETTLQKPQLHDHDANKSNNAKPLLSQNTIQLTKHNHQPSSTQTNGDPLTHPHNSHDHNHNHQDHNHGTHSHQLDTNFNNKTQLNLSADNIDTASVREMSSDDDSPKNQHSIMDQTRNIANPQKSQISIRDITATNETVEQNKTENESFLDMN